MGALAYGIMEIKSFLNHNFIERETRVKQELNKFLNGELPQKKNLHHGNKIKKDEIKVKLRPANH